MNIAAARPLAAISVLSFVAAITACSGDDADENAGASAAALEEQILANCNYRYTCPGVGDSLLERSVLPRDAGSESSELMTTWGGQCFAGHLTLTSGGKGFYKDYQHGEAPHAVSWAVDGDRFEVCEGLTCVACKMLDVPGAPPSSAAPQGKCTGYRTGCAVLGPGSCAEQDGCFGHTHYKYNGGSEFECDGVAKSCDEYDSKLGCEHQEGCSWSE